MCFYVPSMMLITHSGRSRGLTGLVSLSISVAATAAAMMVTEKRIDQYEGTQIHHRTCIVTCIVNYESLVPMGLFPRI